MIWQETNFSAEEQSPRIRNIQAQIEALRGSPSQDLLKGTYSTKHLFESYRAGIDHVGGIAALSDRRYALVHTSRPGKKALAIVSTGENDTEFLSIGDGDHAGAIQAAGKILAIPIYGNSLSGSQIVFVDCRNKKAPKVLSHLTVTLPSGHLNAVGLVFDPVRRRHYLLGTFNVNYGKRSASPLYKSNGFSLFDTRARFSYINSIQDLYVSQGGSQLFIDDAGKFYVAALYRTEPEGEKSEQTNRPLGEEHIALSVIENPDSSSRATLLTDRRLYDTGAWLDFDPGFRWGGTIETDRAGKVRAVAVSRTLAYGPAQNYAKLRIWSQ